MMSISSLLTKTYANLCKQFGRNVESIHRSVAFDVNYFLGVQKRNIVASVQECLHLPVSRTPSSGPVEREYTRHTWHYHELCQ